MTGPAESIASEVTIEVDVEEGEVCKARDGKGLTSVGGRVVV